MELRTNAGRALLDDWFVADLAPDRDLLARRILAIEREAIQLARLVVAGAFIDGPSHICVGCDTTIRSLDDHPERRAIHPVLAALEAM